MLAGSRDRWLNHLRLFSLCSQDLLLIGNQSRPKIFDLDIRRPSQLYQKVVGVSERVTLVGFTIDPKAEERAVVWNEAGDEVVSGYKGEPETGEGGKLVKGLSGESIRILKAPGESHASTSCFCSLSAD